MSSLQEKAKVLLRAVGEPEANWRYNPLDWVTNRISPESVSGEIESLKRTDLISILDEYVRPGQRVLEVGFGRGRFMHYSISRGCVVTGIENERILVEQLKAIKPEYDLEFGDALDLAYDDASFDLYHAPGLIFLFRLASWATMDVSGSTSGAQRRGFVDYDGGSSWRPMANVQSVLYVLNP